MTGEAGDAPVSGGGRSAEQVRGEVESVLLRVVTAGRGYAADCRRLVELAGADEELGERARKVLATVRAWATEYEQRQHDISVDHDGENFPDGHEL